MWQGCLPLWEHGDKQLQHKRSPCLKLGRKKWTQISECRTYREDSGWKEKLQLIWEGKGRGRGRRGRGRKEEGRKEGREGRKGEREGGRKKGKLSYSSSVSCGWNSLLNWGLNISVPIYHMYFGVCGGDLLFSISLSNRISWKPLRQIQECSQQVFHSLLTAHNQGNRSLLIRPSFRIKK